MGQVFFVENVRSIRGPWISDLGNGSPESGYVGRYEIWYPHLKSKFGNITGFINFLNGLEGVVLLATYNDIYTLWVSTESDVFTIEMMVSGMDVTKYVPKGGIWDYVRE